LVIEKTLARNLAHPLHEAGRARRSRVSGLAKAGTGQGAAGYPDHDPIGFNRITI
jgi:hypothetical protein